MKSPRRSLLPGLMLGLGLVAASVPVARACERCQKWGPFYKETTAAMTRMEAAMTQADGALAGNPDADFIALMVPHHQGAIDMARAVLLHGADPALKNMAQEVIAEQTVEIAYLQKIRERLQATAAAPVASRRPKLRDGFQFIANAAPPPSPPPRKPAAGRSRDRVYTGDQVSNTVSVIDPGEDKLLGLIKLGEPSPAALTALYKGQSLVHGLGFSPDGSRLCVVSIGSNSILLIDTASNKVLKTRYLGRSPHEAFFTPDGREIYAAVRGEDYVVALDAQTLEEVARIKTNPGPGMVLFRPDGKYAFVPSSFTAELCVIDCASHAVIARVPQASPFSPNLAVSADGAQVWFTLKDSGQTQVMSAEPPFAILGAVDSGPITNHVTTVDNARGHFAYVTVGGIDAVKVYRREPPFALVATVATGAAPHGVWGFPDGARVYVGLENESKVQAIDTATNQVAATIAVGQLPQALVYVPGAAAHPEEGAAANLIPLSALKDSRTYQLRPRDEAAGGRASVTVISLGLIDQLQISASGLAPGQEYTLSMVDSLTAPRAREPLAKVKANPFGTAIVNTLGPVRGLPSPEKAAGAPLTLILEPADEKGGPSLWQK